MASYYEVRCMGRTLRARNVEARDVAELASRFEGLVKSAKIVDQKAAGLAEDKRAVVMLTLRGERRSLKRLVEAGGWDDAVHAQGYSFYCNPKPAGRGRWSFFFFCNAI